MRLPSTFSNSLSYVPQSSLTTRDINLRNSILQSLSFNMKRTSSSLKPPPDCDHLRQYIRAQLKLAEIEAKLSRQISISHAPSLIQTSLSYECGAVDQGTEELQQLRVQLAEKEQYVTKGPPQ
jgi:hypothetical protein